jgi:hypothetical protein
LLAGAAVAAFLREHNRGLPFGAAVALVTVAVCTALALGGVWAADQGFVQAHDSYAKIPRAAAEAAGGPAAGADVAFTDWLGTALPPNASFHFVTPTPRDQATYQWATYRLAPRLAVDDPKKADWFVFDGVSFTAAGYQRSQFGRVVTLKKDFFVAEPR